jgi:hypothetical protein
MLPDAANGVQRHYQQVHSRGRIHDRCHPSRRVLGGFRLAIFEPQVSRLNPAGVVWAQQSGLVGGKCFHPPNQSHRRSEIRENVARKSLTNPFIVKFSVIIA